MNAQPINPNVQPANVNAQPTNTNAHLNNVMSQPTNVNAQPINPNAQLANINAQPTNMNAQPTNINAQTTNVNAQTDNGKTIQINENAKIKNNNTDDKLTKLFETVTQIMYQFYAEKSFQKLEGEQQLSQQIKNKQNDGQVVPNGLLLNNNQICNDPMQELKYLLINQLLELYNSPNQNKPSNNLLISQQQNPPSNNQQTPNNRIKGKIIIQAPQTKNQIIILIS